MHVTFLCAGVIEKFIIDGRCDKQQKDNQQSDIRATKLGATRRRVVECSRAPSGYKRRDST